MKRSCSEDGNLGVWPCRASKNSHILRRARESVLRFLLCENSHEEKKNPSDYCPLTQPVTQWGWALATCLVILEEHSSLSGQMWLHEQYHRKGDVVWIVMLLENTLEFKFYLNSNSKAVRKMRTVHPHGDLLDHWQQSWDAIALVDCQRHNVGIILFILMLGKVQDGIQQGVSVLNIWI